MKEWLTFATEHAVVIIDVLALIIIFVGTVECFLRGMGLLFSLRSGHERRDVWLRYARWLVAGLTFQLAADIIETSISTGWRTRRHSPPRATCVAPSTCSLGHLPGSRNRRALREERVIARIRNWVQPRHRTLLPED